MMARSVRLFLWFLLGVGLSAFSVLSFAGERYPTSSDGLSGEDICKAFTPPPAEPITLTGECYKDDGCPFDQNGGVCNHRYSINYTWAAGSGKKSFDGLWGYCPTAAPFRFNGACHAKPPCEMKAGKFHNNGMFGDSNLVGGDGAFSGDTTNSKFPDTFCLDSCQATTDNLEGMGSGATWYGFGNPKFTGASCETSNPSEKTPANKIPPSTPEYDCVKAGKGYGTFNGNVICTEALKQQENKTNTKTETKTDGSKTQTKTDSQVKCDGSVCTTTTTTTTTEFSSSGTQTGQTTKSESTQKPDPSAGNGPSGNGTKGDKSFCAENPGSAMCKEGAFSGSCSSGFTCEGDPAACASAKALQEHKCEQSKAAEALKDHADENLIKFDQAKADAALNKDGSKDLKLNEIWESKRQTYLSFASGCPVSEKTFTFKGQSYTLDLSIVCTIGEFVKVLMHLGAYMFALRLFQRTLF